MKILKAKNHLKEFKLELFKVSELRIIPSDQWLNKRVRKYGYKDSFEKHGMLYPIVVSTDKPDWVQRRILKFNNHHKDEKGNLISGLYVHVGNKRVLWAKENSYDMIEGYLVEDQRTKNQIQGLTHIAHTSIPK